MERKRTLKEQVLTMAHGMNNPVCELKFVVAFAKS